MNGATWRSVVLLFACMVSGASVGWAYDHPRGNLALSLGGSAAHSSNKEIRRQASQQKSFDGVVVDLPATETQENYTETGFSLFLSGGYTVIDHLELGLLGSLFETTYQGTDRTDYSLYDAGVYAKYFFDNRTSVTPYVKLRGGRSWMTTGDYGEQNDVVGAVGGLECYGLGPLSVFAEMSSEYRDLGGDRVGYEWRNQVYLGLSFYRTVKRAPAPVMPAVAEVEAPVPAAATGAAPHADPVKALPDDVQRWVRDADHTWDAALKQVDRRTAVDASAP